MSLDVQQRPRAKDSESAADNGVEDAARSNASPNQQALAYLTLRSELTDSALVGLHQALVLPELVHRVVRAGQAGGKLAAAVDTRGRAIREIVKDRAFDWANVAEQRPTAKQDKKRDQSPEPEDDVRHDGAGHRDLATLPLREAFDLLLPLVATSPEYEHESDARRLLLTVRPRLFNADGTLKADLLKQPRARAAFAFLKTGATWQDHAFETVAAFNVVLDPIVQPLLHRQAGPAADEAGKGKASAKEAAPLVRAERPEGAVAGAAPIHAPAAAPAGAAPAAAREPAAAHHVAPDAAHTEENEVDSNHANTGTDTKSPKHARAKRFSKLKEVGGYSRVYELPEIPPVLTFLPRDGIEPPTVDVFLFFHGKFAHYGTDKGDNPAQQSHLAEAVANSGRNVIAIAPSPGLGGKDGQFPLWSKLNDSNGYKKVVDGVLHQLSVDLSLGTELAPNRISLVGHSAGGAALGDAAAQLGDQVRDVTLQDAGYEFGESWKKLVPWFLTGKGDKTVRVITHGDPDKVTEGGVLAKHLDVKTLRKAMQELKIAGATPEWQPGENGERSVEGLHLHHRVVVHGLDGSRVVSVFNFNETGKFHFEVRNRTMGALLRGGPEGDFAGKQVAHGGDENAPAASNQPRRHLESPRTQSPTGNDGVLTPEWAADSAKDAGARGVAAAGNGHAAKPTDSMAEENARHAPEQVAAPRRRHAHKAAPDHGHAPVKSADAPAAAAENAPDASLLAGNIDASQAAPAPAPTSEPTTPNKNIAPSPAPTGEDRYLGAKSVKETKTGQKVDKKTGKLVEDIHHYDGYEGYDIGSSQRMINSGGAASSAVNVAAQVETGGAYDNAQTYDRGVLSFGIMQWTLHQGSLVRFLDYLKNKSGPEGRAAFDQYFKANKIDIIDRRFVYDGQIYEGEDQMHGLVRKDLRTSKQWAMMFHQAGLDSRVQKAQFDYAVNQFNVLTKGSEGELDKHTVIPSKYKDRQWAKTFSADYKGHYGNASEWCEGNPKVATLFYSMYTNNPLGAHIGLLKAINKHYARHGLDRGKWPVDWKTEFAATVEHVYGHEMFVDWQDKLEDGHRTHEGRVSKTMRIYEESLHGASGQAVASHQGGAHGDEAAHPSRPPTGNHPTEHQSVVKELWQLADRVAATVEQAEKAVEHALAAVAEFVHGNPQVPPAEVHRVVEHVRKAGAKAQATKAKHHGRSAPLAPRAPAEQDRLTAQPPAPHPVEDKVTAEEHKPADKHATLTAEKKPAAHKHTAGKHEHAPVRPDRPEDHIQAVGAAELAGAVAALNSPQVSKVARDVQELAAQSQKLLQQPDKNEMKSGRQELLAGIARVHDEIAALDGLGIPVEKLAPVKARLFRTLQEISPYHSQGRNVDILEDNDDIGKGDKTRTCNITSLSMALEGLGKGVGRYKGDQKRVLAVASHFQQRLDKAELSEGGTGQTWDALKGLRLPDFMELAAIAEFLGNDLSADAIKAAAKKAWNEIKQLGFLQQLAEQFDATAEIKNLSFKALEGVSKAQRKGVDHLIDLRNAYEKSGSKHDRQKYLAEREKNEGVLDGASTEKSVPLAAYKSAVMDQLGAELNSGAAIETHVSNHFVRVHAINDEFVIIDDPGQWARAEKKVLWEEARAEGMFDKRLVLR